MYRDRRRSPRDPGSATQRASLLLLGLAAQHRRQARLSDVVRASHDTRDTQTWLGAVVVEANGTLVVDGNGLVDDGVGGYEGGG
jgi:hypothetical protein